ncbi:regulator of sigma E protease [Fictibacillus enclensis]|uniref:Zinc metalloprotease n=1 Tax=Fictibacillus enclensis TaxID=1017270 RepID=A0A0V8JDT6_9BACL|nr:RIP metalloprotease RseP [Fictibacillus enclensis]KSU85098.1 RIP metalloprotease RseP [Fictibacillus enclensis]SCB90908.1 regulator of sigma E protease [Fictibacillus enclensis]
MNTVISIVIILGALVFFHELGHLMLAKRAGILCREFAIGFGPKLFAFKKSETTYTVRLLPLGGFVRMAGEDPEGIELKPGYRVGLIFNPEGSVQKIIVNHKEKYDIQKVITVENADLEHRLVITGYENEEGERQSYSVDPQAMYVADYQEMQIAPYNRQFGSKTLMQRTLAIFAGPFMNVLLAFIVLMSFSLFQGIPTKEARLGNLAPGEAAVKSGLQKGDRIVSVNGDKVSNWEELVSFIQQNPGEKLVFEVDRNGKILNKEVTPGEREINKGTKEGFIGAYPSTEFSLPGSVSYGAKQTWFMTKMIFVGLGELITGKHGFDQLSGPVGIYEYTNKATEGGIPMLMQWAAVLSINLAIFNLLPLPALDGGRLLFLLIEALRGKPIDPQKEGLVHFIGFAFLMLLMLVVTWNDIHKFFLDKIDQ